MQPKRRIPFLDGAEQILVPLERQIRVVTALQQQLSAAERDRLVDLAEDLSEAQHVSFRRADGPIERAEVAARNADVRVVDVAIDDVGDDPFGMLAGADLVGELPEQGRGRAQIQLERLGSIEPAAAANFCRKASIIDARSKSDERSTRSGPDTRDSIARPCCLAAQLDHACFAASS